MASKFVIETMDGSYKWSLVNGDGGVLAVSPQWYGNENLCRIAIAAVKRHCTKYVKVVVEVIR